MATKKRILKLAIIKLKESIFHSKEEGGLAKECPLEQGCHMIILHYSLLKTLFIIYLFWRYYFCISFLNKFRETQCFFEI